LIGQAVEESAEIFFVLRLEWDFEWWEVAEAIEEFNLKMEDF
jgi:hypothetical protein